jgi:Protein of unknown function (DUF357).
LNKTQKELREMTKKFLDDLDGGSDRLDGNLSDNFEAYVSDARHFLDEEDYIRAFEAAVFASGILESETRLQD